MMLVLLVMILLVAMVMVLASDSFSARGGPTKVVAELDAEGGALVHFERGPCLLVRDGGSVGHLRGAVDAPAETHERGKHL